MAKASRNNRRANAATRANSKSTNKGSKLSSRRGKNKAPWGTCRREKEVESWWSMSSLKRGDGDEGDGTMLGLWLGGACTVAKAFAEQYQSLIDIEKLEAILEGYRQFLAVKKDQQDWEGRILSPCCLVAAMWELHSQLPNYESDMQLLCGFPVQYGRCDCALELETRVQATVQAIRKMFGSVDGSVWNVIMIGVDRLDREEDKVPCYFRDKTRPLSDMFMEWAAEEEVSLGDFEFFYKKRRISDDDTPSTLGMRAEDDVDALPRDRLRILVRDVRGEELVYSHQASDMLSYMMRSYAEDVGAERTSLVFTFRGKMMFGHELPRDHGLGNYDTIEAMPASSYKYARCACCNPSLQGLFAVEG